MGGGPMRQWPHETTCHRRFDDSGYNLTRNLHGQQLSQIRLLGHGLGICVAIGRNRDSLHKVGLHRLMCLLVTSQTKVPTYATFICVTFGTQEYRYLEIPCGAKSQLIRPDPLIG